MNIVALEVKPLNNSKAYPCEWSVHPSSEINNDQENQGAIICRYSNDYDHEKKDQFISEIIDSYYLNNEDYMAHLVCDTKTNNQIYASILYKYIKLTELNHTNFTKILKYTMDAMDLN
eukprot:208453_1